VDDRPYSLELKSAEQAHQFWEAGLRHGVLSLPPGFDARVGERIRVWIGITGRRQRVLVEGEVSEVAVTGVSVYLDHLPQGLHELFAHAPPYQPPLDEEEFSLAGDEDFSEGELSASDEISQVTASADASLVERPRRRVWSRGDDHAVEGFTLPDGSGRVLAAPPRFAGAMGRKGWSPVLLTILRDHLTGVLEVDTGQERCWVYCRGGYPVHVVRTPPRSEDSFEHHAIQRGYLAPEVAAQCRHLAHVTGRTFMSVVMRLQLLCQDEVDRLREHVVGHALWDALYDLHGEYRFFSEPELEHLFNDTPAPVVRTLVRWSIEQQGEITLESAQGLVQRHGGDHVFLTRLGVEVMQHLGLGELQGEVLHALVVADGRLAEVAAERPGREREIIQLLFGLLTLGLLDTGEPAAGPAQVRLQAERRLRSFTGRLGLDLFSLVGCHWTDVPQVLSEGVDHAMGVLLAVPALADEAPDLPALREQLGEAVMAADQTLLDARRRAAYRAGEVSERERQQGAAMLLRQGMVAAQMGSIDAARARLEMALEVDPEDADGELRRARIVEALEEIEGGDG
jgi:hypothetical protein